MKTIKHPIWSVARMKKYIFLLYGLFFCTTVMAGWSQPGKVTYMSLGDDGYLYLQLSSPKVGGCAGRFYMMDLVGDPLGEEKYSLILAHKTLDENITLYATGACIGSNNAEVNIIKTEGDNFSY